MSMNQFTMNDKTELDARSKGLRRTIVKILDAGRRGHVWDRRFPSGRFLRVLYDDILHYDAKTH